MKVDRREEEKVTGNLLKPIIDLDEPESQIQIPDVSRSRMFWKTDPSFGFMFDAGALVAALVWMGVLFKSLLSDGADTDDRLHGVPMEQFRTRRLRSNVIRSSELEKEETGASDARSRQRIRILSILFTPDQRRHIDRQLGVISRSITTDLAGLADGWLREIKNEQRRPQVVHSRATCQGALK